MPFKKPEGSSEDTLGRYPFYRANLDVYKTAEQVDLIISSALVGSVAKMGQYGYFLYMGSPKFSLIYLTMWSLLTWIQYSFLSTTFLQQVYLID